jgi:hypothetical protein
MTETRFRVAVAMESWGGGRSCFSESAGLQVGKQTRVLLVILGD